LFAGHFPKPVGKKEEGSSFKQDYMEGLRRVWNDRLMRGIVAVFPAMFMVWSSSFMLIQVLLIKVWKLKPMHYGIIETCIPIGYIIAASIIMILDKKLTRRGRFMIGGMIVTVPVYISLALLKNHAFIFPHVLLLGFLLAFSTQFLFILIRTSVESAFQGRLFGVLNTIGGLIPPVGIAISSYYADIYGASMVLIVNAGLLFIVALLGIFVFKEIWKVN
jgi:MFS family permease